MEQREPKNKRTIGVPPEDMQVYLEDYVYTYLRSEFKDHAAILTGKSIFSEGTFYVYIMGAIDCPSLNWSQDELEITQRAWNYIYQELRNSFEKQEIVGWYIPLPEEAGTMEYNRIAHLQEKDFSGADMVFFCRNEREAEESFFVRREGKLLKLPGYYIYYEKNPRMREYIMMKKEELQLEEDLYAEQTSKERVVMRYRDYMNSQQTKDKRQKSKQREKASAGLAYAMCVLAFVGMFLLSIGIAAGYQQINQMEEAVSAVEKELHMEFSED